MLKKNIEKKEKSKKKKLSEAEYEKAVISLAEKGLTSEKIGEALRKEGIHSSEYNQKISKILKAKEVYTNSDIKNLEKKLEQLSIHAEKNKQDKRALRDRVKIAARLRRLKKHFEK